MSILDQFLKVYSNYQVGLVCTARNSEEYGWRRHQVPRGDGEAVPCEGVQGELRGQVRTAIPPAGSQGLVQRRRPHRLRQPATPSQTARLSVRK